MTRLARLPALLAAALLAGIAAPSPCPAQEAADRPAERVERGYDIGGLAGPPSREPVGFSRFSVRPFQWMSPHLAFELPEEEPVRLGWDRVYELVRTALPPEAAEATVARGGDDWMQVTTAPEHHRRVESVIESLRRSVGVPYEIDVRSVRLDVGEASDALLAQLAAADAGDVPPELAARILAADARGGAEGGTVRASEGRWTKLEQVRWRSVVADWDVEIAQAASIADPIPRCVEEGLRAAVRASRLLDGRALLTVTAAAGDLMDPFRRLEMRTKDLGAVELPEVRAGFAASETALRVGQTAAVVLAAPLSDGAAVRRVVLVRLVSAPQAVDLGFGAILPAGAFGGDDLEPLLRIPAAESVRDENHPWGLRFEHRGAGRSRCTAEEVVESIGAEVSDEDALEGRYSIGHVGDWPGGGAIVVQGSPRLVERARRIGAQAERDAVRTASVRVRLVRRPASGEDQTLGLLAAPVLVGRSASLAAYSAVPYVADYDVEVAQEARIADPIPTTAIGGAVLNVRLVQGPAQSLRADLELVVSHLSPVETASAAGTEVGVVERVPTRRARVEEGIVLERGKEREIDLGVCPWGGGRLLAFVRAESSAPAR